MTDGAWTWKEMGMSAQLYHAICARDVEAAKEAIGRGADPACPYDEDVTTHDGRPLTPAMKACEGDLPHLFFGLLFGTRRTEVPLVLSGAEPITLPAALVSLDDAESFYNGYTVFLNHMSLDAPLDDVIWDAVKRLSKDFSYDRPDRSDGGPALAAARAAHLLGRGGVPDDISEAIRLLQSTITIKNGPSFDFSELVFKHKGVLTRFCARGFPIDFLINGMPLLHSMVYDRNAEVAKEILTLGADVDAKFKLDKQKHYALQSRHPVTYIPEHVTALEVARLIGAASVAQVIEAYKAQQAIQQVLANHRSRTPS